MARETVGEAFVAIRADGSTFGPDLRRAIESNADAPAVGKKIGDDVGKGVSSGVSTALKAAGGLLVALGASRVIGDINAEARESQKVGAQTEAVLKSTAGAANIQADAVGALANELSKKAGIDDEVIQSGENMLLTFRDIRNEAGKGNDIFNQATKASLDLAAGMAAASGGEIDLRSATIQVGKALNDPIAGLTALRRVGVSFTDQQKEQIKTLVESGDKLSAQKIILHELTQEFGGSAAAQATAADKAGVSIKNLEESVGVLLLPVVDKAAGLLTTLSDGFQSLPGPVRGAVTYLLLAGGAAVVAAKGLTLLNETRAAFAVTSIAQGAAADAEAATSWGTRVGQAGIVAAAGIAAYLITQKALHAAFDDHFGEDAGKALENLDKRTSDLARSNEQNLLPSFKHLVAASYDMKTGINQAAQAFGEDFHVAVGSKAVEAMARFKDIADQNVDVAARLLDQIPHESKLYQDLARVLYGVISAKHDTASATDDLNASTEGQNKLNGQAYDSLTKYAQGTGSATTALNDLGAAQKEENDQLTLYKQLLEGTQGLQGDVTAAQIALGDATDNAAKSLFENGTNFDLNTAAGRKNVSALQDQVKAADALAEAVFKQTGKQDDANAVMADFKTRLDATLYGLGLNTAEVEDLERKLGLLQSPPPVVVTVDTGQAIANLIALEQYLSAIGGQNPGLGLGPGVTPPVGGTRDSGGPVWPGTWLVGESGPELLTIGAGGRGRVTNAGDTRRALGGGDTYNLYWSAPRPDPITLQRDLESKRRVAAHLAAF